MTTDRSAAAAARPIPRDVISRGLTIFLGTFMGKLGGTIPDDPVLMDRLADALIAHADKKGIEVRERRSEPVCVYPDPECQKEMSALFAKHGLPDPFARATGDGE
jgi:hypothetical protein